MEKEQSELSREMANTEKKANPVRGFFGADGSFLGGDIAGRFLLFLMKIR